MFYLLPQIGSTEKNKNSDSSLVMMYTPKKSKALYFFPSGVSAYTNLVWPCSQLPRHTFNAHTCKQRQWSITKQEYCSSLYYNRVWNSNRFLLAQELVLTCNFIMKENVTGSIKSSHVSFTFTREVQTELWGLYSNYLPCHSSAVLVCHLGSHGSFVT